MLFWLLLSLNLIVSFPIVVLTLECLVAAWPARWTRSLQQRYGSDCDSIADRPPVWVLIPAHNEDAAIAATLRSVRRQLRADDAVCVVADNSTDRTAAIARELGAEVVERTDPDRRGKGYALEAGLEWMRQHPRPVVVVIDADCLLENDALNQLAMVTFHTGHPLQARYLMAAPPLASPRDVISRFAVIVKNLVRPIGLQRLGGPALLTGSGMAFPWQLLSHRNLATGHIVEDMQLGFDLLLEGHAPLLLPTAGIQGTLAESGSAAITQRTRWEHGHMHVMTTQLPRLLFGMIKRPRWKLFMAALDLTVPPLSFLVALWSMVWFMSGCYFFVRNDSIPFACGTAAGVMLGAGIWLAWFCHARHETSFWSLMLVPFYVVSKLPIYLKFVLFRREKKWIRTTRAEGTLPHSGS